jgi:hypothetical protein
MKDLSTVEIIILVVAGISAILILGWRSGGPKAAKIEREAERIKELDE